MNDKTQEYLQKLATDFPFFLEQLWIEIGMPSIPRHHIEIAKYLQTGARRRGVLAWRGAAKTWITIAYCLWRLFTNAATERITYVSKSERAAKESLYLARKWLGQARFLQHLVPDRATGARDSALMFDVAGTEPDRTPSFCAYGITGQITGSRSTCVIGDDIETSENTLTMDMRRRLKDQVAEFENILIPGGDIIYLGTPHHEETVYEALMNGGYAMKAWPVSHPGSEGVSCPLGDMYADMEEGELAWPERFNKEEMAARESAEGRSKYSMQYLLRWKLGEDTKTPLRLSDIIVFAMQPTQAPASIAWGKTNSAGQTTRCEDIISLGFVDDCYHAPIMFDKEWQPYTGIRMWVDPSGKGTDETAIAVVAHLNGYLWVLHIDGMAGGYSSQVIEKIAQIAKTHHVDTMYVEDNFGQGMMVELLQPAVNRLANDTDNAGEEIWGCSIETVRVSGQKEIRIIETLEPILNQHRLIMHPTVAADKTLQRQLTRLTRLRGCLDHDDRVEALAMACKMWKQDMAHDPDIAAQKSREKWILAKIKEMNGSNNTDNRWFKHS